MKSKMNITLYIYLIIALLASIVGVNDVANNFLLMGTMVYCTQKIIEAIKSNK